VNIFITKSNTVGLFGTKLRTKRMIYDLFRSYFTYTRNRHNGKLVEMKTWLTELNEHGNFTADWQPSSELRCIRKHCNTTAGYTQTDPTNPATAEKQRVIYESMHTHKIGIAMGRPSCSGLDVYFCLSDLFSPPNLRRRLANRY